MKKISRRSDPSWCSSMYPSRVAPTEEALGRLSRLAEKVAGDRFSAVEVVPLRDRETAEPSWVAVVRLSRSANGAAAREQRLRLDIFRAVNETYPGEWFGRLVVDVQ